VVWSMILEMSSDGFGRAGTCLEVSGNGCGIVWYVSGVEWW